MIIKQKHTAILPKQFHISPKACVRRIISAIVLFLEIKILKKRIYETVY
jgi:hypothetical protein